MKSNWTELTDELTVARLDYIYDSVLGIGQELMRPDNVKLSFSDDFVASDKSPVFE